MFGTDELRGLRRTRPRDCIPLKAARRPHDYKLQYIRVRERRAMELNEKLQKPGEDEQDTLWESNDEDAF